MKNETTNKFIESYKKAIKLVPVLINGKEIELPIIYNANASIVYAESYESSRNYRYAFCTMIYKIIGGNKKFVYKENEFPDLTIEDIENLEDKDLEILGETIINNYDYFDKFYEEITQNTDDFFERFYLVHLKEQEIYKESFARVGNNLKSVMNLKKTINSYGRMGILNEHIIKFAQYRNIINPNTVRLANTTSQIVRATMGIEAVKRSLIEKNEIFKNTNKMAAQMQSAIYAAKLHNPMLGFATNEVIKFKDIYNVSHINSIQRIIKQQENIARIFKQQNREVESVLKKITSINHAGKIITFSSLNKKILTNLRPFLFDIETIRAEKESLNIELKAKAETLKKLGWWFITDISEEFIELICENAEKMDKRQVNEIICGYFKQENYRALDEILNEWMQDPYFKKREQLLRESIESYKDKKYASMIQAIIFHIEGIIRDFVRDMCGFTSKEWKESYKRFKDMAANIEAFVFNYVFYFIDSLYRYFNPNYPEKTDDFNRHKIAHGQAFKHGTQVNALKTILYLNEIFYIMGVLKTKYKSDFIHAG